MWWHEGAMTSIDNATLTGTTASGAALGITQVGARDVVFTLDGSGLTSFPLPAGAQGLTAREAGGTVYAAVTQQNTAAAGDTTAAILALRAEAWAQMFSVPRPWPAVLLKDVRADGAMLLHYSDARGQVLDVFRHATGALDTLASPGTGFKCWPTVLLSSSRVLGTCQDMAFASTGIGVYAWDPPDYTPRLLDPHAGAWFLGGANDAGLVVGTLNVAPGQGGPGTVPVAWTAARGLVDLRPLIRGGAPWVPTEGRAVNANGQILVRASKSTGVTAYLLLTPRP